MTTDRHGFDSEADIDLALDPLDTPVGSLIADDPAEAPMIETLDLETTDLLAPARPEMDPVRQRTFHGVERLAEEIQASIAAGRLADNALASIEIEANGLLRLDLSVEMMMARALPDFANDPAERRLVWTTAARAMAAMAPTCQGALKLGTALAGAHIAASRVQKLALLPNGPTQADLLVRAARTIKRAGTGGVDWRPVVHAMLTGTPEAPLREVILRDYFAADPYRHVAPPPPDDWELGL